MEFPIVRKSDLVGGLRKPFIASLMEEFDVGRAYVLGYVVRRTDSSIKVKPASPDAVSDFVDRIVRGERVMIIDHARAIRRSANGFVVGFRLPTELPLVTEIPNPLDPEINPELDTELFDYDEDPDLDDVNRYLANSYLLFVGSFRPARRKGAKAKTKKKLRRGKGEVEFIDPVVRERPKIPELVLLFIASGFFEPTDSGIRPIRQGSELEERHRNRILGLEVLRRFGRRGPAMTLQLSQPGHGKSSFYKAVLRYFDNVAVFSTPPGKAILYLDERFRPPMPGAVFTKEVVVLDEVGERARKHREERGVVDIRPKIKEAFDEPGVARVAILSNVFDARGKPVVGTSMTIREALSNTLAKAGIRQVEGRAERMTMAITVRETDLHGKRRRSERTLDPKIYRRFKRRYDLLVDDPRLRTHRFRILKNRLSELGIDVEEIAIIASNPVKRKSGTTVYEHQKAVEELGRLVREAIEARLAGSESPASQKAEAEAQAAIPKSEPEVGKPTGASNPFELGIEVKNDGEAYRIEG